MDNENVLEFLENKCILITGATGFLAKILLEKILRVQPKIKKIYLLLRAKDAKFAAQRFQNEIVGKDLFRVLKEKCGENWNQFLLEKTSVVVGDISADDELGIKDPILKEEMCKEIDLIVNSAATTSFDERYDVAFDINTMGALHVLNFASRCIKLKTLVHVSTAFVSGETSGLIPEKPYPMGASLNGVAGLDIEEERMIAHQRLKQLQAAGAAGEEIKAEMKDLGLERARKYGWPNTYVFTKVMGEMLVEKTRGNMSVAIIRPSIVTSTYKEPFPGWVEGMRTIDTFAVAYGTGRMTIFLANLEGVIDMIPADMVVNATVVAMVLHARQPLLTIYQVASSVRHPVRCRNLLECGYSYFTQKPWIGKDGKPVVVKKMKMLQSVSSFNIYMTIRYLSALKFLEFANIALCHFFDDKYYNLNKKFNFLMRLVELYRPYLFFTGFFDDMNTERLRAAVAAESQMFYFDPKMIDWDDYLTNKHIPGVVKYVFK